MKYLIKTEFRGYLIYGLTHQSSKQLQMMQSGSESHMINESKIKDLGLLCFLAMLRIDIFSECPQGTNNRKNNLISVMFDQQDPKYKKSV